MKYIYWSMINASFHAKFMNDSFWRIHFWRFSSTSGFNRKSKKLYKIREYSIKYITEQKCSEKRTRKNTDGFYRFWLIRFWMIFSLRGRKTRSAACWKLIFGYVMYFVMFFRFLLKLVFKKVRIIDFDGFFDFA